MRIWNNNATSYQIYRFFLLSYLPSHEFCQLGVVGGFSNQISNLDLRKYSFSPCVSTQTWGILILFIDNPYKDFINPTSYPYLTQYFHWSAFFSITLTPPLRIWKIKTTSYLIYVIIPPTQL